MDDQRYAQFLGVLLSFFDDPGVDEVLVNGAGSLWLAVGNELAGHRNPFSCGLELARWVQTFARSQGVRLDPVCGSAGGSFLGCAYRWHCVLPPLAPDGPLFSLRRHRFKDLRLDSFVSEAAILSALSAVMNTRGNLLIAGPTGTGKTTALAALLAEHAKSERVAIMESTAELPLPSERSIRLLERRPNLEGIGAVTLDHLLRESLRMRPDRLVVGEVRGAEARALCEALMTGHHGVMATIHANNPEDALVRLAFLMGGLRRRPQVRTWEGLPLAILMMARGRPPKLVSLTHHRFVPSF